jgi:2-methylcitrate dehydratase PrpD
MAPTNDAMTQAGGHGERLARWAANVRWEDLRPELQAKVEDHVLDTLGVMCAGLDTPHALAAQRAVRAWNGTAESTVVGRGWRLPAPQAAFLNAFHARAQTFDDTFDEGPVHPGSAVVSAALACAEAAGASGALFLAGVAAGYEVATRVSAAVSPWHYQAGFHTTGTCNVFGACAAAGRILGLDPDAMVEALGLAGQGAGGLRQYQVDGSMADTSLDGARAAQAGVMAAHLRAAGLPGARGILDGPWGFCRVMAPQADLARLDRDLGTVYAFAATALKPFPTCRFTHGPIEALLDLRRRHDLEPEAIREVTIATFKQSVEVADQPDIRSRLDAILSHQYAAALALATGRIDPDRMAETALADPEVRALAARVRVAHDPRLDAAYPARWPHRVTVTLQDGRAFTAQSEHPPGGQANPLSPEQIAAKFRSLAAPILGGEQAERLLAGARSLDATPDVRGLTPLLAPAGVTPA